jgi:hypothetical protein
MASEKPPPYFPQGSLAPPDPNRYRNFKMIVAITILGLILLFAAAGIGIFYLIRSFF